MRVKEAFVIVLENQALHNCFLQKNAIPVRNYKTTTRQRLSINPKKPLILNM